MTPGLLKALKSYTITHVSQYHNPSPDQSAAATHLLYILPQPTFTPLPDCQCCLELLQLFSLPSVQFFIMCLFMATACQALALLIHLQVLPKKLLLTVRPSYPLLPPVLSLQCEARSLSLKPRISTLHDMMCLMINFMGHFGEKQANVQPEALAFSTHRTS